MPDARLQEELASLRRRYAAASARTREADQILAALAAILGEQDPGRIGEAVFAAFRALTQFDRGYILAPEADGAFRTRFATHEAGADARVAAPALSRIAAGAASAMPDARRADHLHPFLPGGGAPVSALMLPFADRTGHNGLVLFLREGFGLYQADEALRLKRFGIVAAQGLAALDEIRLVRDFDNAEREREVAHEANIAKSRLLGRVSHELRTPLNGVLGAAHLLRLEPLTESQRRLLDDIETCGGDMLRQVSDLIDFAAAPAPARTPTRAQHSQIACLAETVADQYRIPAAAKGLTLELEIGPGLEDACVCAASAVRRALCMLADNAVKYTSQGAIHIVCAARADGGLEIAVSDTGAGMSEDLVSTVFEPFRRGDASRTTRVDGLGLGLPLAERLIGEIGGTIALDTAPGAGVRAAIVLPAPACIGVKAPAACPETPADRRIA